MKTLAIKHNRPMNYERQFGLRFMTGGWYRQMVVGHYHSHKTTINPLRWAQFIYYCS
jgi:hypothetical protein